MLSTKIFLIYKNLTKQKLIYALIYSYSKGIHYPDPYYNIEEVYRHNKNLKTFSEQPRFELYVFFFFFGEIVVRL